MKHIKKGVAKLPLILPKIFCLFFLLSCGESDTPKERVIRNIFGKVLFEDSIKGSLPWQVNQSNTTSISEILPDGSYEISVLLDEGAIILNFSNSFLSKIYEVKESLFDPEGSPLELNFHITKSAIQLVESDTPIEVPIEVPTEIPSGNFNESGDTTAFGIPRGLVGNIARGRRALAHECARCHTERGGGYDFPKLSAALRAPPMNLRLEREVIADLVAYLNRGRSD